MSDRRLRELERRWKESGDAEDRKAYEAARRRAGLPRLVVRHFIPVDKHGVCGPDGKIDAPHNRFGHPKGGPVWSQCGVQLWPRQGGFYRKNCYYTEVADEVTCKTCLKSMSKTGRRKRTHYAPGSKNSRTSPVCGRDDSEKFNEVFSHTMTDVNCPACKKIMEKGRRRARRPRRHKFSPIS